jgi:hypothetical protein
MLNVAERQRRGEELVHGHQRFVRHFRWSSLYRFSMLPMISCSAFPLDQASAAHEAVLASGALGKIALIP